MKSKSGSNRKYQVYMVEDSDAYRTLVYEFLTRVKNSVSSDGIEYSVKGFSSGEECLNNLNKLEEKPDVVILDHLLDSAGYTENSNGLMVMKKIKEKSSETDVVVMSCQKEAEVVKEFWRNGADEYVFKSNSAPIMIYDFISKSIRKKEQNRKLIEKIKYLAVAVLVVFAALSAYFLLSN